MGSWTLMQETRHMPAAPIGHAHRRHAGALEELREHVDGAVDHFFGHAAPEDWLEVETGADGRVLVRMSGPGTDVWVRYWLDPGPSP